MDRTERVARVEVRAPRSFHPLAAEFHDDDEQARAQAARVFSSILFDEFL